MVKSKGPESIRSDVDNLIKMVLDSLEGIAYKNDRQVVAVTARKRWTRPDEPTQVRVVVEYDTV